MKIVELSKEVIKELSLTNDDLEMTNSILGEYENFINSSYSHILSLPNLSEFFFENNNNGGEGIFKVMAERYMKEFGPESEPENVFKSFIAIQTICALTNSILDVIGRVCDLANIKSLTVSLKENKSIGVRAIYVD